MRVPHSIRSVARSLAVAEDIRREIQERLAKASRGEAVQVDDISSTPSVESTPVELCFNSLKVHCFQAVGFKLTQPANPLHRGGGASAGGGGAPPPTTAAASTMSKAAFAVVEVDQGHGEVVAATIREGDDPIKVGGRCKLDPGA